MQYVVKLHYIKYLLVPPVLAHFPNTDDVKNEYDFRIDRKVFTFYLKSCNLQSDEFHFVRFSTLIN